MTTENLSLAVQKCAHQPHDPKSTLDLAGVFSEAVRSLVYATAPSNADQALIYPRNLYDVIGAMVAGPRDLDQLMRQCEAWLRRELDAGHLTIDDGPNAGQPSRAFAQASGDFDEVRAAAGALAQALVKLQSGLSNLEATPLGDR